jgi:hypothetical protein
MSWASGRHSACGVQAKGRYRPRRGAEKGRPPKLMQRSADHQPLSAKALAESLPVDSWQTVTWHEGSNVGLASRFAAVRLRVASRAYNLRHPRAEEWLLLEWPEGDKEPLKYWLSTLSGTTVLRGLIATTRLRWRIERDYRELKQELALAITRAEIGEDSITTPVSASRPAGSSSPNRRRFPPQHVPASIAAKTYRSPQFPIRHGHPSGRNATSNSIATLRRRLTVALARRLMRCPCCARAQPQSPFITQ